MKTEAVVIGGGATGAGVFRDLALRGVDTLLVEKDELTSGTSGRNHGLLHSGARYAVRDPESARECISENKILKRIAQPCIEDTGGLFLSLPGDPPAYPEKLFGACENVGIPAEKISPADVLQKEPALSPRILKALMAPDGAVDPFRLIRSNVDDGQHRGASFLPHCEVTAIETDRGTVRAVLARNTVTGEPIRIECRIVVNAAGVWAGKIARLAGASLDVVFSKGSLIVFNTRLVNTVINRCRPPSNGDIFVPHGPALILGTTSLATEDIDDPAADEAEVDLLLEEGEKMLPGLNGTRAIRAYAGVRPLMGARESEGDSRTLSRDFLLLDHGKAEAVTGLYSIVGGKLTTYRLMAEKTADSVCHALGNKAPCTTAEQPLPFPGEYSFREPAARLLRISDSRSSPEAREIYCECELVSREEILQAMSDLGSATLKELQERTRAGMGPCQGGFCSSRLTALMSDEGKIPPGQALAVLRKFLEERWKGTRPILWGAQMKEEQLIQALYSELFNLDHWGDT